MKLKMITHVRFLQARFLTGLLKLVLKREIRKLIPSSIQIETAEKYKDHKIPSVNLFSDSGSSRQQIHSCSLSELTTTPATPVQIVKSFRFIVIVIRRLVLIGNTFWLEAIRLQSGHFNCAAGKVELFDVTHVSPGY